jgi:hypothetical protein
MSFWGEAGMMFESQRLLFVALTVYAIAIISSMTVMKAARRASVAFTGLLTYKSLGTMLKALESNCGRRFLRRKTCESTD